MNYFEEYQKKLVSADEAVKVVKSDDHVCYGEFVMNSQLLDSALARRKEELRNVQITTSCCPFVPQVVAVDPEGEHFTYIDRHFSGASRKLHDDYKAFYNPLCYHDLSTWYTRGYNQVDVLFIKLGSMDSNGMFNIGTSNSISSYLVDAATIVVAEVNSSIPRCLGSVRDSIHISKIDYLVEGDNQPLLDIPPAQASETDQMIARLIMEEIEDGACLQLGIGGMPNAIGNMIAQSDLKDLGVHTEMLADAYVDCYEQGRITGKRKTLDQEKMVYTFAMGSKRLYDFMDNNPVCLSYPANYTNDPYIIAQNDKVVALNNALEVDLYGQVCSESSGIRHISGTGGQLDFIMGAYRSKGGKGFICLSSTYKDKDGQIKSRIKPTLEPGSIITVPRVVTTYVMTEFGKAFLKGKSTYERAEELIKIAHPQFRDELVKEAQAMKIWRRTNKIV